MNFSDISLLSDHCLLSVKLKICYDNETDASISEFQSNLKSKKTSNDQELIQSDPISCPQNQKGNN